MTTPIETADDDLQFQTAEPAAVEAAMGPVRQACANCKRPITSTYFAVGRHPICADCRVLIDPAPAGSKFSRLFKAAMFGLGAGLLGAILWFAVRRVTNMEIGLIAIVVGFMVGKAVRKGSGNRGGRGYQVLAVVLTYCCIAANYVPDIVEELIHDVQHKSAAATDGTTPTVTAADAPTAAPAKSSAAPKENAHSPSEPPGILRAFGALVVVTAIVFGIAMAAPFLMGAQNILGLLIIGFALWEAWKFNRRVILPITGPYQLGSGPIGTPGTGGAT